MKKIKTDNEIMIGLGNLQAAQQKENSYICCQIMYLLTQREYSPKELKALLKMLTSKRGFNLAIKYLKDNNMIGERKVEFDKNKRKVFFIIKQTLKQKAFYETMFSNADESRKLSRQKAKLLKLKIAL